MKLEWTTEYESAEITQIKIVEERLGIFFPSDFVSVISLFQGGKPNKSKLIINEREEIEFDCLLTFLAFDELDILDKYNTLKAKLGIKIIPFALEKHNGVFCFDFNENKQEVVYWNGTNLSKICNNFTEFEEMLEAS